MVTEASACSRRLRDTQVRPNSALKPTPIMAYPRKPGMAQARGSVGSLGSITCSSCGDSIDMSALASHVCGISSVSPSCTPAYSQLIERKQVSQGDQVPQQQGVVAGLFQIPSYLPASGFLRWGKAAPPEIDPDAASTFIHLFPP